MIGSIQHRLAATLALATLAAPSFAQSEIHGVNLFGSTTYSAMSDDFLGTWFPGSPASSLLYGIDFDATATTLYGVESGTLNVFTFDWMGTGAPTATGVSLSSTTAMQITGTVTGLTAAPSGDQWYLTTYSVLGLNYFTDLWVGDITTGQFTFEKSIQSNAIFDIAMDSNGDLFGLEAVTGRLLQIGLNGASDSIVGSLGFGLNCAQGLDFDWSTGQLFATVHFGPTTIPCGVNTAFLELDPATGQVLSTSFTSGISAHMELAVRARPVGDIGMPFTTCIPNANSTGATGVMSAFGSTYVADNNVTLTASNLPNATFGFFLASQTGGDVNMPGGSMGRLCLGGSIGRFVGPGQIMNTMQTGAISLGIDLTQVPDPQLGLIDILAGELWGFQLWHRDSVGGSATSNFTDALLITFQ